MLSRRFRHKGRLERLKLGPREVAQQELHVGTDRVGRGSAVVILGLFLLEQPPGRGIQLGNIGPRQQRKRAEREIRVAQGEQGDVNHACIVCAPGAIEREQGDRGPLSIGHSQIFQQRIEVKPGVPQPHIALTANRAAVADQTVDMQAGGGIFFSRCQP